MEFKVYQKELELQSRGWIPTFHDVSKEVMEIVKAVSYTHLDPGGRVTLVLDVFQDRARLWVHNTGVPIPPDRLEHLFERFYRADDSRSREKGGYGLGLAIAHSIVETHKGRITVQSGNDGTVFTVLLPLHRA